MQFAYRIFVKPKIHITRSLLISLHKVHECDESTQLVRYNQFINNIGYTGSIRCNIQCNTFYLVTVYSAC